MLLINLPIRSPNRTSSECSNPAVLVSVPARIKQNSEFSKQPESEYYRSLSGTEFTAFPVSCCCKKVRQENRPHVSRGLRCVWVKVWTVSGFLL